MGNKTGIAWCDHTFNPWWGCVKVSEGCKFCYAERDSKRWGMDLFGPGKKRRYFGEKHWDEPLKWDRYAKKDGRRHRVFCMSMGDLFEMYDDNGWINLARIRAFRLIESTPNLDWLLLTKRPENVLDFVPELWKHGGWPDNAWFGFTAENQAMLDRRQPISINIPAPVKFISVEPMLDAIDFRGRLYGIDWVIFGAESGANRRPCTNYWVADGVSYVKSSGKKVFVKQLDIDGRLSKNPEEWPNGLRVQEFPT